MMTAATTTNTTRSLPRPQALLRWLFPAVPQLPLSERNPRRTVPWSVVVALTVLGVAALAAAFPGLLAPHDPLVADPTATLLAPSTAHVFGTDIQGRDIFSRVIYGARYSLLIGLGATVLALVLGSALGLAAGVAGRRLDGAISRTVDVLAAFPEVLLALLLITFTGQGTANLILALGIAGIPRYARLVRGQVRVIAASGYVDHARTFGLTKTQNILRHVLPNALGALPIVATIGLGGAIIGSAGLSFLGLGPQPPAAEWGLMLAESRAYLRHAWWSGVFPGVALTTVVVAATVVGHAWQAHYERRTR